MQGAVGMKRRVSHFAASAALLALTPHRGEAEDICRLCRSSPATSSSATSSSTTSSPTAAASNEIRSLEVEIIQPLDFGRLTNSNSASAGSATSDPSGEQSVTGGVIALGGLRMSGRVRLRGEPDARVQVELPNRVAMVAPDGSSTLLVDIETDLPPVPRLGPDGMLEFGFGGRLILSDGAIGQLQGRIIIDAQYE